MTGPVHVARETAADCRPEARSTDDNPLWVAVGTEACVDLEPNAPQINTCSRASKEKFHCREDERGAAARFGHWHWMIAAGTGAVFAMLPPPVVVERASLCIAPALRGAVFGAQVPRAVPK